MTWCLLIIYTRKTRQPKDREEKPNCPFPLTYENVKGGGANRAIWAIEHRWFLCFNKDQKRCSLKWLYSIFDWKLYVSLWLNVTPLALWDCVITDLWTCTWSFLTIGLHSLWRVFKQLVWEWASCPTKEIGLGICRWENVSHNFDIDPSKIWK